MPSRKVEEYPQPANGTGTEYQQPEGLAGVECNGPFLDEEQQLTRSSSASDIRDQCSSDIFQVRKTESSQNLTSDSPSVQEIKGTVTKGSSTQQAGDGTAEFDPKTDVQQLCGIHKEREKTESVSSDTSIGYNSEVDITLVPWQACEEDHDAHMPTDISVDPDACHWLPLNPSDGTNLT
ncbi:UNVERIFIED_CONTAM: hypothetical protein K2H54_013289, partial [Gekko kuhli]